MNIDQPIPRPAHEVSTPYASVGMRFLAMLLDGLILAIPSGIANQAAPGVGGIVIWFLYAPIFESSAARATPGKFLLGLQVTSLGGQRISLKTAALRSLMKLVSACLLFLGFVIALFTARKQGLHDLVMDTVVVPGKHTGSILDAWVDQLRSIFGSNQSPTS